MADYWLLLLVAAILGIPVVVWLLMGGKEPE